MEIQPDIDCPHDREEVIETYNEILEEKLSDAETLKLYNTILFTASLLAKDLGFEVTMPFAGFPKVMH